MSSSLINVRIGQLYKRSFLSFSLPKGNGELSFPDFLSLMASKEDDDPDKEMKQAFKVFDRNGDGFVSAAELKLTMKSFGADLNEYEVNEIIEAADFNHDGKLDYNGKVFLSSISFFYYWLDQMC